MGNSKAMNYPFLQRAIPNEQGQLILDFSDATHRLFDMPALYREKDWPQLGYPQYMKRFTATADDICWPEGERVDVAFLYQRSKPVAQDKLENQVLRLSYKNQAPTSEDQHHHVYGVYLAPYSAKLFRVGESIGGGIAERGGGYDMDVAELLAWPQWRYHFALSGCNWAATLVEAHASKLAFLIDALIGEACRRNGIAEET